VARILAERKDEELKKAGGHKQGHLKGLLPTGAMFVDRPGGECLRSLECSIGVCP